MINFAAITPHPPLLIPNIGKENIEKLKTTKEAMEDLEKKLITADIETLIIISSYHKAHHNTYGIVLNENYITGFKEFADFETKIKFLPDLEIIEKIRHATIDNNIPLNLIHNEKLDYAYGVPLYYLCQNKNIKIVPFSHTYDGIKKHYELGRYIKNILTESNKKIGIIASGNLSHRSNELSPQGMLTAGKKFNDKFIELIETKNTSGLLGLDEKKAETAEQSILLPTSLLMGIIDKINYKPQVFSFEAPLGIGYMVCNFKLL